MKKLRNLLLIFIIFITVILSVSAILYSPLYMKRIVLYGESDVLDYKIFPYKVIKKSEKPIIYEKNIDKSIAELNLTYSFKNEQQTDNLDNLLKKTGTTSFLIVKRGKLIYEVYYNGYNAMSTNTSFSMAKSIVSLLIGCAIDEGYINSENDSIAMYIDEFKNSGFESITIKNLLTMRSPINYEEGKLWFGDDSKTYYAPNLRELALHKTKLNNNYNGKFHYNNYHPLLLGVILERSTNKSVSEYFSEKIWSKIGTEYDATWSLDSDRSSFEKMESGINFKSIDFIKIGSLLINDGLMYDSFFRRVLNNRWITKSTNTGFPINNSEYEGTFLNNRDTSYQYMWYSTPNANSGYDYYAAGKYGQVLYVSRKNSIVILRTGKANGEVDWWPDILKEIAKTLGEQDLKVDCDLLNRNDLYINIK